MGRKRLTSSEPLALSRFPPDREWKQDRNRQGHHEPRLLRIRDQRGQAERKYDSERRHPVVAGDEIPDPQSGAADPRHVCSAPLPATAVRNRRTRSSEKASTLGTRTSSAASPPGHSAPAPSAPQKMPN